MSSNTSTDTPGLIGSHVKYVNGVAQEAVGAVTGSQEWQNSGDSIKSEAIKEMREATQGRDASSGYGKVEEFAGKAVGCEGMEKEGAASKQQ